MLPNEVHSDKKKHILLAEDCPDSRLLLAQVLKGTGAEVSIVDNGQQAVDSALEARRDNHPYNLILMDIQMPVLNGYDAARALRAEGVQQPILAISTRATAADEQATLAAGCNEHISKLAGKEALVKAVKRYLETQEPAKAPAIVELPVLPILPEVLKEDPDAARQAIPLLEALPEKIADLQAAIDENDREQILERVLELGRFSLYGYSRLSRNLMDLQQEFSQSEQPLSKKAVRALVRTLEGMHAGVPEIKRRSILQ